MNKKELTEHEIRTRFITPALQEAGWGLEAIREEYTITKGRIIAFGGSCKREDNKTADYVLFYKLNKPIAIVEAKNNNLSVSSGMQQALKYAKMMNVPFVFSSNGDAFAFHNKYIKSGEVEKEIALNEFPSPEQLWQMYKDKEKINQEVENIIDIPYFTDNKSKSPRYYQMNAINKTVEAIARGKKRLLLVMATGTGKTYTAFQIMWRLWKHGTAKRILFLADRNVLLSQSYNNDFAPFKEQMTIVKNRKLDPAYEIYLALYQGLTGEEDKKIFKDVSKDFFDLIIIDECHRGSASEDSQWREILDYFSSAVQIGLTATPKDTENTSNFDYFGEPLYTYSLKEGIADGFLAPYKVHRISLDKDIQGFRPSVGQVDIDGNLIPDKEYTGTDIDKTIVLDTRTKMVAKVVSNYLKMNDLRFEKTIFFCVDTEHAERMRIALVNENADLVNENDKYVMRMTGDDEIGKAEVENFIDNKQKYPVLVTTSKLLTTGVDAKMVKNIVLDANINSITEFKQIIGRGTRIVEELDKMYFTIFDFRNVTRLFADPDFDGESLEEIDIVPDEDGNLPSGITNDDKEEIIKEPKPQGDKDKGNREKI